MIISPSFRERLAGYPQIRPEHPTRREPTIDARETVARAWCEILDVPAVEPDDDFFDLGGDSMSAIRLVSQVESELGVVFPLETLFRDGSFKEIVEALEQSAR